LDQLEPVAARLGERLWLAPSCSLLHVPLDVNAEAQIQPALRSGLAFALQKLDELRLLQRGLKQGRAAIAAELKANQEALAALPPLRQPHLELHACLQQLDEDSRRRRSSYPERAPQQRALNPLPLLPTTTIGSFPQTDAIRA